MMQRDNALHEEESHAAERAADMPGVNTNAQADENEQAGAEQPPRADDILTIVFTADNHLGSVAFGVPPQKREQRAQRLRRAFQQATDFAIGQGVDFFIQGGDLFDTPTPDERDRSFVAERLAQLKQASVRALAVGGFHDTPLAADSQQLAPQQSYARLGALHYFAPADPSTQSLEPLFLTIRGMLVGIAGLGAGAATGDPLAHLKVNTRIE